MVAVSSPAVVRLRQAWREPLEVLAPLADEPFAFALLSDGSADGRWSYVGCSPSVRFDGLAGLRRGLAGLAPAEADGPPFQGGAVGLAAFEWGAALEPAAPQDRRSAWPDLTGGIYEAVAAFDHHAREVWAIGRGADPGRAEARARAVAARLRAAGPVARPPPLGAAGRCAWDRDYPAAVAEVVAAITAGEVFQANVARGWGGRLPAGCTPFHLLCALHETSPAPFAGYVRSPHGALVSRSPERFLRVSAEGRAEVSPIKGTRPRGATPALDEAMAAELLASGKDRAENLMIVDVVRNDLSRVCTPGGVQVEAFCELRSFSNVHHLVSTVCGRLAPGRDALSAFALAFPPASVSGAPKLQALRVIARHEPPRGPYCGSLFWAGFDGALDSSVLIRSVALELDAGGRWRWEARAGAGVTAESRPDEEDAEAVQKARAVLAAFGP